jgi:hypothetical protein
MRDKSPHLSDWTRTTIRNAVGTDAEGKWVPMLAGSS